MKTPIDLSDLSDDEKVRYFDHMWSCVPSGTQLDQAFELAKEHFNPPAPEKGEIYKSPLGALWIVDTASDSIVNLVGLSRLGGWVTPVEGFGEMFTRVYPRSTP